MYVQLYQQWVLRLIFNLVRKKKIYFVFMKNLQRKKKYFFLNDFVTKSFFEHMILLKPNKKISTRSFNSLQLFLLKQGLSLSKIKASFLEKSLFVNNIFDITDNSLSFGNVYFLSFSNLNSLFNFLVSYNQGNILFLNDFQIYLIKVRDQLFSDFFIQKFMMAYLSQIKKNKSLVVLNFFLLRQFSLFVFFMMINKIFSFKFKTFYLKKN